MFGMAIGAKCCTVTEIASRERGTQAGVGASLEVLLNGPPRRARGKLSKRMTRIRGGVNESRRAGKQRFSAYGTGAENTENTENTEYTDQY